MNRARPLRIFVHSASECLTDHESHGDGLICFALLDGLARRGHEVFAYARGAAVDSCSDRLRVRVEPTRSPAGSLAPWEHALRANRWFDEVDRSKRIDLVWRMHPYGRACPLPPRTRGRPLVVGPLFYDWPASPDRAPQSRLGVSPEPLLRPLARRGWVRTLARAALLICATEPHAAAMQREHSTAKIVTLPVIVDPPTYSRAHGEPSRGSLRLAFVGNLVRQKDPRLFCEIVAKLRDAGWHVHALVVGDGPERATCEGVEGVTFTGKIPNARVFDALAGAHWLASTSVGEPYGRAIVEAMSVGTPAVCHRSGGPADLIADGVDGLLVHEADAGAYARLIIEATERGGWPSMSAAARAKASAWRAARVIDRLEAELLQAVAAHERQAAATVPRGRPACGS